MRPDRDPEVLSAFNLLAFGMAACLLWLPTMVWPDLERVRAAFCLGGAGMLWVALGRLSPLHPRLVTARLWVPAMGVLALADLIYGNWTLMNRGGTAVVLPVTLHLTYFLLGGAVWQIAGALIELAGARQNITLRDAAAGRRDLYLGFLVLLGMTAGPVMTLVASHTLRVGVLEVCWAILAVYQLVMMYLWYGLARRAAGGFAPDEALV